MSFQYCLFQWGVKAMGVKKQTALPEQKLIALSRKMQAKNPFTMPKDDMDFSYEDYIFYEKFHCIRIQPKGGRRKRAVLYCYGGGMMTPPADRYLTYAKEMGRQTGREVWYPYYPLCSDYSMLDAVRMVTKVYEKMLTIYTPDEIAFYGFSSGGSLLISLLLYNQEREQPLPKPNRLIAIAPGGCPANEEEYEKMLALDNKDIEISAKYMKRMRGILEHGQKVPEYMLTGNGGDYSGLPETWLYYGGDEILSAKAKGYGRAMTEAGIPHHIMIRKGMCHCYCIAVKFPEAKEDYDAIIRILS